MNRRIALIDADGDIFAAAARSQIDTGEGDPLPLRSVDEIVRELTLKWQEQQDFLEADLLMLFFTSPTNWRKQVLPSYKENRDTKARPILNGPVRQFILSNEGKFATRIVKDLEADDLCGIASTAYRKKGFTPIVVSPDKDLRTVPGLLWNPRPTALGKRREVEEITDDEAFRFHMKQTLEGDSVDNYKGCPRIGPVKALKYVNGTKDKEPEEVWQGVVEMFEKAGLTEEDALTQARVAHILQDGDWDKKTGKVKLWEAPRD